MTGAAANAPAKSPTAVSAGPPMTAGFGLAAGVLRRPRDRTRPSRAVIVDAHQLRGGARLLECLGDDERDRLVIVLDLGAAEQLGGVELALAELAGILAP